MIWLLIPLGCALFAYLPLILIVNHSRRPKPQRDDLVKRYVEDDAISTEEFVKALDEHWANIKHAPLK